MGHIKEPKGIDFIIESDPLTDKTRQEISEFIRDYKSKSTQKKIEVKHQDKTVLANKHLNKLNFHP